MTLLKYSDRAVYGSLDLLFGTVIRPSCIAFPLPWPGFTGRSESQLKLLVSPTVRVDSESLRTSDPDPVELRKEGVPDPTFAKPLGEDPRLAPSPLDIHSGHRSPVVPESWLVDVGTRPSRNPVIFHHPGRMMIAMSILRMIFF